MQVQKTVKPVEIDPDMLVKVTESGSVTAIMQADHRTTGATLLRLDKDTALVLRTGEVIDIRHAESRADNLTSVSQSLAKGRDIINANVTDPRRTRWVTLTYRENMTDPQRLKDDFKEFNRRARKKFGHYEYITCAEPQARGAWHLHIIMIFDEKAPFLPNRTVRDLWGQGFVNVQKIADVDNLGAYLSAYLGDLPLEDAQTLGLSYRNCDIKRVGEADVFGQQKRYIKGARMRLYPPGMHIFRWSRGIIVPEPYYITYAEAKEKVSADTLTYSKEIRLFADDYENTLRYEYYNSKREKSQAFSATK